MTRRGVLVAGLLSGALLWSGCATYKRRGLDPEHASQVEKALLERNSALSRAHEERILALDPARVTGAQVGEVLGHTTAPRIINIHGGIFPVHRRMISFSEFLIGMGYPPSSITNPADGTYTFSCYESSETVAGMIAWYYEREGLRPMIVGHSQGGMQVVKILHKLAGQSARRLAVWSPLTWKKEDRYEITDPLMGSRRPVVGLQLPYATALNSGGLTRLLPNQWDMCGNLRDIPNSVEEFTGFHKHWDLLGGDFLGYGPANLYHATSTAAVRNVRLPTHYDHGEIPNTQHLLKSQAIKDWINNYQPKNVPADVPELDAKFEADSRNILWAADVWYSIKKHWVLELQRHIRAKRSLNHAD